MTPLTYPRVQLALNEPQFQWALLKSLVVSVAYYVTAKLGFEFTLQPGSISTLWMPNSILLAGLLLTPRRWWWIVVIAALPAHLASELQSGVPALMVLSWFVSNSAQALIGASLIYHFAGSKIRFSRPRDLTTFLIFGAFLAPFLASFLDSALIKLNDWGNSAYWENWRIRFFSNVLAALTLIPFVIEWAQRGISTLKQASLLRYVEGALILIILFVVSFIVFNTHQALFLQAPSRLYWPLPVLVWASIRFGVRGVSAGLLIVMFLAIDGATHGGGPFVASSSSINALSIQGFLIVIAVPLLILAAVIEERQVTEAAARDSEERLTLALNAAQMDTWDWQIATNRLTWSATTTENFGVEPNREITLEFFYTLIHPEDRAIVEDALARALEDGSPYEVEFRIMVKDKISWYLSKGKVYYDEAGKPSRMLGVGIDITDKKQAQHDLVAINARNQAILRAVPDYMFLQDKEGVFLDYFTRDPKSLFVPPQEFLGKNVSDVLPKELAERVHEVILKVNEGDEPQVLEYSLPIANEERHFEARLVSAEGPHILSIVRDVTEMRRATEIVRQSEERLMQSTRKIRDLAARLITAQESERRRIAVLLHDDVGQNVAALGLALSRLKRKLPGSDDSMLTELNRLTTLVHDLSKQIRQLSHQLHPEVLEHLGLIAALESHVAEIGDAERISIRFSAEVDTDPIPQDVAVCLYRVALEAVRNVAMHSGASSADVTLRETDGHLVLEVSDSGKGFDLERIRHETGLGLASSKERVRLLHGVLEIRSNSHAGTRLTARVPLRGHHDAIPDSDS